MLKFKKSIFGQSCSIFINNFLLSHNKFKDIFDTYSLLHNILISGEFALPTLNLTVDELKDNVELSYFKTSTKLSETINGTVIGYDKYKIYEEANPNISLYLDDLPSEYKNIVLNLHAIYDISNKNLNNYRLLLALLGNLTTILNNDTSLDSFSFYNNVFRYIYLKQPLSNIIPTSFNSDSNISSIPTLMMLQLFKRIYVKINTSSLDNVAYSIFNDQSNPLNNLNYLSETFASYLITHKDSISSDISKYIINNILYFGKNVASHVEDTLKDITASQLVELHKVIKVANGVYDPVDYIYRILRGVLENASYGTLITNLFTKKSFIWNIDQYSSYNSDSHDKFYQYEDVILNNIVKYINKNLGILKQIVNIPISFTSKPVYFMNSFSVVFNKYVLNYIQDTECFTYSDLEWWRNVVFNASDMKLSNIRNFFKRNGLTIIDSDYQLATFIILQEFINNLTTEDEFKNFIIKQYIPIVDTQMKTLYKIDIDWFKYVDKIIYLFKLKFIIDLLKSLTGKNGLFVDVFTELKSKFEASLKNSIVDPRKSDIKAMISSENVDYKKWFYIFNSFFKSAAISKHSQNYLLDTYSL